MAKIRKKDKKKRTNKENNTAWKATEKLLKSGIEIEDVFGNLESPIILSSENLRNS